MQATQARDLRSTRSESRPTETVGVPPPRDGDHPGQATEAPLQWWTLPGRAVGWARSASSSTPRPRLRVALSTLAVAVGVGGWAHLAGAHANYTIARGDTLSSIAQRTGVSVQALAEANGISDPDFIVAGRLLVIPSAADSPASTDYVVKRGDTLDGIAAKLGVTRAHLMSINAIGKADRLLTGQILSVQGVATTSATSYLVRSGDHLDGIARRLGTTVGELVAANAISNPNHIYPGQSLSVPGSWRCPVPGASFVNDYGYVKPSGAAHGGVDLFAPKGTPIYAPVGGRVSHSPNNLGGLALHLDGSDGNRYYMAHLDRYGASGAVAAGTVIGHVGNTGDALNTADHLHMEIRLDGHTRTNPFPTLVGACR